MSFKPPLLEIHPWVHPLAVETTPPWPRFISPLGAVAERVIVRIQAAGVAQEEVPFPMHAIAVFAPRHLHQDIIWDDDPSAQRPVVDGLCHELAAARTRHDGWRSATRTKA